MSNSFKLIRFGANNNNNNLPASKTALTHRYNDSKTTLENTKEDYLQPLETILITR